MPDSIEMLQIKNDALEEELETFIDKNIAGKVDLMTSAQLRKKIQMYSNIAYALGYEEGKGA